ncbi:hypothetical protein GCM10010399_41700 [Dactylosporangium fulvum]|uniref:FtsK/SpoIIIE domain-containing protein n=1 Tax=Dactylosporangium fulvum TaxID=53359 RepID=A0ABY5VXL3_9ACTN|nr:FtsK/SpoIIIE domain-containing protein [Dactylosporangium fulvum]UWP82360.1 FtsK/SpoIIIE domain-containing protein [Dactylosporangium fulvum]
MFLEAEREPHLLLFGDSGSGKSSFLRGLARGITQAYQPGQARIILIDYRRSLLGCAGTDHLIGHATARQVADEMVQQAAALEERLPGPDVTAAQLCDRGCGAVPSCSCWSTTTTWWPPVSTTRCCRWWSCSPRAGTSAFTSHWLATRTAQPARCSIR